MTMMQLSGKRETAAGIGGDTGGRDVSLWLWLVAALVFAMVVVGGATRLTESGLSITEWQPLLGAFPPLSEAAWMTAFDKYKHIPQYTALNQGMSLEDFKFIYYWEWSHRLLGRLIGVVFALPLVFFWWTGRLSRDAGMKFLGILALGGASGRHRLVHGEVGFERPHRSQPIPSRAALDDRLHDPRPTCLASA